MTRSNPQVAFAFVWREEQEILARLASEVPKSGLVVEIGTALGGTAYLMWEASRANDVRIQTVDLFSCRRAQEHLSATNVTIVNEASATYAGRWDEVVNDPIDLLYIDGDHSLAGVHQDFTSWLEKVRPGGQVVCHDYDPPQRGHVAHLGVGVFLDTVKRLSVLDDMSQEYKLFMGRARQDMSIPNHEDCFETLVSLADTVTALRDEIFRDGVTEGMRRLTQREVNITSFQACAMLPYALAKDFECLDSMTRDFNTFRRHLEMLSFLDHAYGESFFPDKFRPQQAPEDMHALSKVIAAEQVRISIHAKILRTLVDWDV